MAIIYTLKHPFLKVPETKHELLVPCMLRQQSVWDFIIICMDHPLVI